MNLMILLSNVLNTRKQGIVMLNGFDMVGSFNSEYFILDEDDNTFLLG